MDPAVQLDATSTQTMFCVQKYDIVFLTCSQRAESGSGGRQHIRAIVVDPQCSQQQEFAVFGCWASIDQSNISVEIISTQVRQVLTHNLS